VDICYYKRKIQYQSLIPTISFLDYESVLRKSPNDPPTVAVKLLSLLFLQSELYNRNISGKVVSGKNLIKGGH